MVFDLRELRVWASTRRVSDPVLHSLIFRFDAVLLLPAFHPAEDLIQMPGRDR